MQTGPVSHRLRSARGFALALVVGGAGGMMFFLLRLPLPWMLGAIAACMIAAVLGLPVSAPRWVRPPMAAVVGTLLGSGFPHDILQRMVDWVLPIGGLLVFLVAAAIFSVGYFRVIGKFDPATAYFAGMPGGLVEMTMLGEAMGADSRKIALIHTARILLVVFTIPVGARLWNHVPAGVTGTIPITILDGDFTFVGWLIATCVFGILLGNLLRLPARFLMGPMLISGTLHVSGITGFRIPFEVVAAAQVMLGVTIGCRFTGMRFAELGRLLLLSSGSTAILILLTGVFALALHGVTGHDTLQLILSYSPGGLAEMGLVALALGLDTSMVAALHAVRVILVGFGAGALYPLFKAGPR